MSTELERLVAEFDKFQANLRSLDNQAAEMNVLRTEVASLEVTSTSPDRSVTVVAGPGGAIKDIRFTDEALGQRGTALSAVLMRTLREAVAKAAREQASMSRRHIGAAPEMLAQVLTTQAEMLNVPVEQLRADLPAGQHPQATVDRDADDHDDYAQRSFVTATEPAGTVPEHSPPAEDGSPGDEFLRNLFDQEQR